jgi:hypothetical protein
MMAVWRASRILMLLLLLLAASQAQLRLKINEDQIILPGKAEANREASGSSGGLRRRKWEATSPTPSSLKPTTTPTEPRITVGALCIIYEGTRIRFSIAFYLLR